MAQTDSQKRHLEREPLDNVVGDACLNGRAWSRRNDQVRRMPSLDLVERHLVVADHPQLDRRIDLAEPLNEVVGERIVVIDQKNHEQSACHTVAEAGKLGTKILRVPGS